MTKTITPVNSSQSLHQWGRKSDEDIGQRLPGKTLIHLDLPGCQKTMTCLSLAPFLSFGTTNARPSQRNDPKSQVLNHLRQDVSSQGNPQQHPSTACQARPNRVRSQCRSSHFLYLVMEYGNNISCLGTFNR